MRSKASGQTPVSLSIPPARYLPRAKRVTTDTLGMAFEPEEYFETPDGEKIVFDTDLYGNKRGEDPVVGPVEK